MKIYIAKRDTKLFELGQLHHYKQGDILAEKDGNYVSQRCYPYQAKLVESNNDLFELWKEDEDYDASYYIDKYYTQYEMDKIMEHIGQPPFISHLKKS